MFCYLILVASVLCEDLTNGFPRRAPPPLYFGIFAAVVGVLALAICVFGCGVRCSESKEVVAPARFHQTENTFYQSSNQLEGTTFHQTVDIPPPAYTPEPSYPGFTSRATNTPTLNNTITWPNIATSFVQI